MWNQKPARVKSNVDAREHNNMLLKVSISLKLSYLHSNKAQINHWLSYVESKTGTSKLKRVLYVQYYGVSDGGSTTVPKYSSAENENLVQQCRN